MLNTLERFSHSWEKESNEAWSDHVANEEDLLKSVAGARAKAYQYIESAAIVRFLLEYDFGPKELYEASGYMSIPAWTRIRQLKRPLPTLEESPRFYEFVDQQMREKGVKKILPPPRLRDAYIILHTLQAIGSKIGIEKKDIAELNLEKVYFLLEIYRSREFVDIMRKAPQSIHQFEGVATQMIKEVHRKNTGDRSRWTIADGAAIHDLDITWSLAFLILLKASVELNLEAKE